MIVRRSVYMRSSPASLVSSMLALLAALLVLSLTLAPRAEAFIYWSDNSKAKGTIARANLDGTGVDQSFIGGIESPGSVAVDGRYIYWGGYGRVNDPTEPDSAIARARLDGTKVDWTFIPAAAGLAEGIGQIAVDDDHIYWAKNLSHGGVDPFGSIARANLDGTGVQSGFITGVEGAVTGLAVDANHIYWSQSGGTRPSSTQTPAIGRANLDGTGVERAFIPFPSGSYPGAVDVDAAHIYWFIAQTTGLTIARANLDGTGVDQSFIGSFGSQWYQVDLALDAGNIYWAEADAGAPPGFTQTGVIGRADLDGANVDHGFITPAPPTAPFGVAVNFSLGKLKKDKKEGTAKLTVEVPAPGGVALAETKKLKGAELRAEVAGEVQLVIKPRGRAKKKLDRRGKAKVKAEVTYTPDGGEPDTQTAALKLIKRG